MDGWGLVLGEGCVWREKKKMKCVWMKGEEKKRVRGAHMGKGGASGDQLSWSHSVVSSPPKHF